MFQKRLDFLQAKEWLFVCFLTPCISGTFRRFIPCHLSRLSISRRATGLWLYRCNGVIPFHMAH